MNSTKVSKATLLKLLSQFILSDLAIIIRLLWLSKEKHLKVMSWQCTSPIYLLRWRKKKRTNSFNSIYEIDLDVAKFWELVPGVYNFYSVLILITACSCILDNGTL